MAVEVGKSYVLEGFRLDTGKRILSRDGLQVRLAHRPFQVLQYLIDNRDRMVGRSELLEQFWDQRDVYDEALTKCVGAIRKALDDQLDHPRFIETRWSEGYRFIGQIQEEPLLQTSYIDVERTRELKFVFEETDEKEPTARVVSVQPLQSLPATRRFSRIAAAISLVAVIGVVVSAMIFLRSPAVPSPASASLNSIAVLPFRNLSANNEGDYFSDGMSDSLISALSKIEGLRVISRGSVFTFKGKDADPREVGRKLGVATVLESSIRTNGERVRVNVRLVNTANGEILWTSDEYQRGQGDIFEIQDDIARSVVARLRLRLTPAQDQLLTKRNTNNVEAYQAYVKGRYFWRRKDADSLAKARKFFEEAIRLDPNYALAYAGLADYYFSGIWYANLPPAEARAKGKAAVLKVLQLDPSSPEAHDGLARAADAMDWATFRKEKEKALELDPNNASIWQGYAFYWLNVGERLDEAVAAIKRAQNLDPLSPNINTDVGLILTHAGRLDEAIVAFNKAIEIDPKFPDVYWNLGRAYERKGNSAEAVAAYLESQRLKGTAQERLAAGRAAFDQKGINGFWQKQIELVRADATTRPLPLFMLATLHARLGEKDQAFACLEQAYQAQDPSLVNLKSDYTLDPLRSDPRFTDLVRRVGLNS